MDLLSMAFEVLVIGAIAVVIGVLVHKVVENKGKTRTIRSDFELDVPADYTEPTNPIEVKTPKRARNDKGHFVADDPSTPDVNEAWVDGKAPKTKPKKKKTTRKKTTTKKTKQTK